MSDAVKEKIEKEIKSHKVVLFVKGTPQAPQCGFSASTMELFTKMKVPFHTVDVLADGEKWVDATTTPFPYLLCVAQALQGSDTTLACNWPNSIAVNRY